jgi:phospholipid-transporting ATPase
MVVKIGIELVKLLRNSGTNEEQALSLFCTIAKPVLEFFIALAAYNTIVPLVLDTRDHKQKLKIRAHIIFVSG